MNRFDYSSSFERPAYNPQIVKFLIPGSGGSFVGVAEIERDCPLNADKHNAKTFVHYEKIHCNHINWETKEISWKGIKIGQVLEVYHPKLGGSWMSKEQMPAYEKEMKDIYNFYSEKYPTSK